MKNILLLGAGRSTGSLVEYLKPFSESNHWQLSVGDASIEAAQSRISGFTHARAFQINTEDNQKLSEEIKQADVVISMLPASLHGIIANLCVEYGKSLFTASYVSPEIKNLNTEAEKKGVLILMEMGLDPGIDHMSAMREIDQIKEAGGKLTLFKSFTGGLVAPESDNNPWNYKFTWNPKNVVLAGQGTVKFIRNGKYKYIIYHNLFKRLERVQVPGYGSFEGYANRDSLKYRDLYGIQDIPTLFRGTLRKEGFCKAWDVFVQLGITDDTYVLDHLNTMTYRDFLNSYLVYSEDKTVEDKLGEFFGMRKDDPVLSKLKWLGILDRENIPIAKGTPAEVLQLLLEKKWGLDPTDKDMVVMQHQFDYELGGEKLNKTTSLVVKGENASKTSMAKTVGLPLGISVRLYLEGKLELKGVHIPVKREIYNPVLDELEKMGINFF